MSFSILKKSTRRSIGIAAAIVVTGIIIYGFLSTYQQTKNDAVPKVNLVQAAIYGSDRTEAIPLLYEAVAGEPCIQQLTFAAESSAAVSSAAASSVAVSSSVAASSVAAESVVSSSVAKSSQRPKKSSKSSQPALEPLVPEPPLLSASSPVCLQQLSAPEGYEKLGAEGSVGLALNLAATGRIERAEVEKSSGFAELDAAALQQVQETWQFEPCKQADKAVACRQYIRFRWQIK